MVSAKAFTKFQEFILINCSWIGTETWFRSRWKDTCILLQEGVDIISFLQSDWKLHSQTFLSAEACMILRHNDIFTSFSSSPFPPWRRHTGMWCPSRIPCLWGHPLTHCGAVEWTLLWTQIPLQIPVCYFFSRCVTLGKCLTF